MSGASLCSSFTPVAQGTAADTASLVSITPIQTSSPGPIVWDATAPGMVNLFLPQPTASGGERIDDLMSTPIEAFRDQAARETERYLTSQRDQLVQNFQPCQVTIVLDDDASDLYGPLGTTAAAGFLFTREDTFGGGRLNGTPRGSSPVPLGENGLRLGVSVGGAVLMYAFVDWTVTHAPQELRGPLVIGESALLYQALFETSELAVQRGLLQTGFIGRPNWRQIGQVTPHLFVASYGAAYLYDELGLPLGSTGNTLATFGTSTGLYMAGPSIGARFPRIGTAFNSSLGVGLSTRVPSFAAPAGGAGALGGGFQALGAVGAVALGSWLGGTAVDVWAWASGASDDPDYRVFKAAWDTVNHEVGGVIDSIFGPVIKGIQSVAAMCSDDFDETLWGGIQDQIDRWAGGANSVARAIDEDLLVIALQSLRGDPNGQLEFDWDSFQTGVRQLYSRYSEHVDAMHAMVAFFRGSSYSSRLEEARDLTEMISQSGTITDQEDLEAHLRGLLQEGEGFDRQGVAALGSLSRHVRRILQGERQALETRASDLGILGQNLRTDQLTPAQRQFLYGDGQTSEFIQRRERIQFLETLYNRIGGWRSTGAIGPLAAPVSSSIRFQTEVAQNQPASN